MRVSTWMAVCATSILVGSPAALAKNNKGNHGNQSGQSENRDKAEKGSPAHGNAGGFSLGDIEIVRSIFVGYPTYRGSALPPGIAKNYARGKPLPPGIAKKMVPNDILVRLPPRPGYTYYIVEDDVVLLSVTGIVIDIILDVFS